MKNLHEENKLFKAGKTKWNETNEDKVYWSVLCTKKTLIRNLSGLKAKWLSFQINTLKANWLWVIPNDIKMKKELKLETPELKTREN